MIFATVGTHQDGFPRMLGALERLELDEPLVVQHGNGAAPANATEAEPFMPFERMRELFGSARVVVTHAGVGSILLATRAGHTPIVVPRRARDGEHVDDHQIDLARALEASGRVIVCWDESELPALIAAAPARAERAEQGPRPLALAVGRALRGEPAAAPASGEVRGRQGKLTRLLHDTAGAYFGVGTDFTAQRAGPRADPARLAGYYCDFSHKAAEAELAPGSWLAEVIAGRPWKSPMMAAQAGLGLWERQLAGEPLGEQFLAVADWLLRYGVERAGGLAWEHDYAVPKYGLEAGWISGMTQGEAISVLLRAHAASGEQRYLDGARRASAPFTVDVADGGVVRELDGRLVIEEYPARAPIAVLNGWIFGLIGLYELMRFDGGEAANSVYARARAGLLGLLPRFDVGWWSRYSLGEHGSRPDLAKPFYQRLHVVLLDALDLIEPDPLLAQTARRWERQITPVAMTRIAVDKVVFRAQRALPHR